MFKILVIFLFINCAANAQSGSWTNFSAKGTLNDKWSIFTDDQLRSWQFYDHFYYYELETGVNYNVDKNFVITGAMGKYRTFTNTGNFKQPVTGKEFRTWLQLVFAQQVSRLYFDHRIRIEQRWLTAAYKNRFRYRLNVRVPINHKTIDDKSVYVNANEEIFLGAKAPFFEQNRVFGGIGFRSNKHLTLQGGYINQFDYSLQKRFAKGYVQLSVILTGDLKKKMISPKAL